MVVGVGVPAGGVVLVGLMAVVSLFLVRRDVDVVAAAASESAAAAALAAFGVPGAAPTTRGAGKQGRDGNKSAGKGEVERGRA